MITITKRLILAEELKQRLPLKAREVEVRQNRLAQIKKILSREDDRLLLILGPCSADSEDAFYEYLSLLKGMENQVQDKLMIVPRLYTAKPRSRGDSYKGIMFSADPFDGKIDIENGLITSRRMFVTALRDFGFACADELLHTDTYGYFDDCLAYGVIGARNAESQQHRFLASGVDIPVAFKNPTSGNLDALCNALYTAAKPCEFIHTGSQAKSSGNPFVHAMLRGGVDRHGEHFSNYSCEDIKQLNHQLAGAGLKNPAVLIDTNHSNSAKNGKKQAEILLTSLEQIKSDREAAQSFAGYMVEGYIESGACGKQNHKKGKSVTDECLGWKETEEMIEKIIK